MAIIGDSKILFLDEPSSGMDPMTRRKIWDIMHQLKKDERTIILTTHHLEEAEELSDRIAIMAKGKLMILGTCDYIKKNFGEGYTLTLSAKVNQNE